MYIILSSCLPLGGCGGVRLRDRHYFLGEHFLALHVGERLRGKEMRSHDHVKIILVEIALQPSREQGVGIVDRRFMSAGAYKPAQFIKKGEEARRVFYDRDIASADKAGDPFPAEHHDIHELRAVSVGPGILRQRFPGGVVAFSWIA